jgi:hypothetical protein
MSINLQKGSLAGQVTSQKKEFKEFVLFVKIFMQTTQQRFRDVQGAFAEALLNHETRLIALEKALSVTPAQELKEQLENLIVETAELSNQMDEKYKEIEIEEKKEAEPELPGMPELPAQSTEEPIKQESKIKYHKEF